MKFSFRRFFLFSACLLAFTALFLTGCSLTHDSTKIQDLEFTVLSPDEIPTPLQEVIDENLTTEMKLSYQKDGKLCIARGFGEQKTGGYSICVEHCYLGEDGIHVKFQLIGPSKDTKLTEESSYPYIVIQLDDPQVDEIIFE